VHNYSLGVLASDIQGAVAALGHTDCTLVAHDWGGLVAWTVAGLYGQGLVKRLVVLGLPHIGVSTLNMSGAQYKRSLYMMSFQVSE
jgi:pimeloyl-ACP methyl ester carboxylesterase